MRLVFALASVVALSTCTCEPPEPSIEALPLDSILASGQVSCGVVTKSSELIGGPAAFAEVGRAYKCHNDKIRFIVQDNTRPIGVSAEGGNLIDVDLVRPERGAGDATLPGEDSFREHASAIGANELHVESIAILDDGRNGGQGIIRVTGTPTALTLAPQAAFLAQNLGESTTLVTDYVLHADASYVEIVSTVKNRGPLLPAVQAADFVAFGGAVTSHTPENGFGDVDLFSEVSLLSGARNDFTSYAMVSGEGRIRIPFLDQGVTAPFYGDAVAVSSDRAFFRWLVVGDGSLESTTRVALELQQLPRGTTSGTVVDNDGAPVAGALVAALNGALDAVDDEGQDTSHVINEARTDADGRFTLTLVPGDYVLVAHKPGFVRSAEKATSIDADAAVDGTELSLGRPGTVSVTTSFSDIAGRPLDARPAKLMLVPSTDTQRASRVLSEFDQDGAVTYEVTRDGVFTREVAPGNYTAYVTRGFEWSRFEAPVSVIAGEVVELNAAIAHVVDTTGLVGAEFHQHSLGSIDAQVPVPVKVMENAAEGIEYAASTDHDVVTDFRPHVAALGLEPFLQVIAGSEVSYQGIGHFNAYPWNVDDEDPFAGNGSRFWWLKTVPEMFSDVRAAAGDPILQINHPRSTLTGYFLSLLLNPADASRLPREPPGLPTFPPTIYEDWAGDFDALEVNGNLGDVSLFTADREELRDRAENDPGNVPVLADWFALLGAGMRVSAMGNSDSHHLDEGVGYPRNFLEVGTDDARDVTPEMLRTTIRSQHTSVGEGCLLELLVDGSRSSGADRMIALAAARDDVTVRLQAPPHVTPGSLEVYVNGIARKVRASSGARELALDDVDGALSNSVTAIGTGGAVQRIAHAIVGLPEDEGDLVVVVVSKNGSGLAPTGGGAALCYTAPLYVDVDGDGAFTGWNASTQEVLP